MDAIVEKQFPCKVPGCSNQWTWKAKEMLQNWKHNQYTPPRRMCDSCNKLFKELNPQDIKCGSKDCEEKVSISPYQQLTLIKKGRKVEEERVFCESCHKLSKEQADLKVPCRMKGCKNTWTWFTTSRLRTLGKGLQGDPEPRLCDSCFQSLQKINPLNKSCRVKYCKNTYQIDRMTQLELQLQGKKPAKRMCNDCNAILKKLKDQNVPCQTPACTHTWQWSAFSQLEHQRHQLNDPKVAMPQRYCDPCFGILKRLKPIQIPCTKTDCDQTVEYPVLAQLQDQVAGRKHLAAELCARCQGVQKNLKDKDIDCQQEGCKRTWIWSAKQQFEGGHYEKERFIPAEAVAHYCEYCLEFLKTHSDVQVDCEQCGSKIMWTARQQLMTDLGLWVAPTKCPSCIRAS